MFLPRAGHGQSLLYGSGVAVNARRITRIIIAAVVLSPQVNRCSRYATIDKLVTFLCNKVRNDSQKRFQHANITLVKGLECQALVIDKLPALRNEMPTRYYAFTHRQFQGLDKPQWNSPTFARARHSPQPDEAKSDGILALNHEAWQTTCT